MTIETLLRAGGRVCRGARLALSAFALLLGSLAPSPAGPPPAMPPAFDEATVRNLVEQIGRDQNATVLQMGYFARRSSHPFPPRDGLRMVKEAINAEPPASKRWCLLQRVRAFAGFHLGSDTVHDGFAAYAAVFDHAPEAVKQGAAEVVWRCVYELVSLVPGSFASRRLVDEGTTEFALEKALHAYLYHLRAGEEHPYEVDWAAALARMYDREVLVAAMEKALADPALPRTYAFLRCAAAFLQRDKPERALALLREARPLLPPGDVARVHSYFDALARLLSADDLAAAVAARREEVALTGSGRAALSVLCVRAKDTKALDTVLAELTAPDASEGEINCTAEVLRQAGSDARKAATALLRAYLAADRTRDTDQELRARLTLARLLVADRRPDEARAVLLTEHIKPPFASRATQARYDISARLHAEIVAGGPGKEGDPRETPK